MTRREFFFGLMFQEQQTAVQVEVMEVFSNPTGPSALLIHHATEATRNTFAEWLRRHSGVSVVCRLQTGTQIDARIFRVNMCFGRGLILTTARAAVQIRPRDVLTIEFG